MARRELSVFLLLQCGPQYFAISAPEADLAKVFIKDSGPNSTVLVENLEYISCEPVIAELGPELGKRLTLVNAVSHVQMDFKFPRRELTRSQRLLIQHPAKPQGVHRIASRFTFFVIFSCPRITVTIIFSPS
jgi:hypothetical protein